MNVKKSLIIGMLDLAPLSPLKAQKAAQIIPEVGCFGTLKSVPTLVGGINGASAIGKNYADVFIGGSLNRQGVPSFVGIAFDNYSWNKNISSWVRDFLMASKNGITSTLDVAPVKYNTLIGNKLNFAVMPAYCRQDNFLNGTTTHNIKAIVQSMFSINSKNRLCLEMQYGSIPNEKFSKIHFGKPSDCFQFHGNISKNTGRIIIKNLKRTKSSDR